MTEIAIYSDDVHHGERLVGRAFFTRDRRKVSTTFVYEASYLSHGGMNIDPSLQLVAGAQYFDGLLPAFSDSAPDRWGRNLLDKAERIAAREEGRSPRQLDDVDYLLGVSDNTRQGALRFYVSGAGYVGQPSTVPKLVSLPALLRASEAIIDDLDPSQAVKALLDTGTTGLGGARPKASVLLEDGALAIAKFPHSADQWDVMAWEAVALEILKDAGVQTPSKKLVSVGGKGVLLLRRFDRDRAARRRGYISALTALSAKDGEQHDYLEIAQAVRAISTQPRSDLHELFDRVVVGIVLGNTDDHLRNHGFVADRNGWRLSPAFDVNPNPELYKARATSIFGAETLADEAEVLMDFAAECSLSVERAKERIQKVAEAASQWRQIAALTGIGQREITMMEESLSQRLNAVRTLLH